MSWPILQYSSSNYCVESDKNPEMDTEYIDSQSIISSHTSICHMDDDTLYSFDEESFHELRMKKPWNNDPYFFGQVKISVMAALKMLQHSISGGTIEVMGLLQGKILLDPPTFLIMDSFALPVEGTETRVDAQAEGYEHSVQYVSFMKSHGKFPCNNIEPFPILGWYHSHPSYGCWLSGIDVNNQRLHQSHEEPFLAIVIDPIRSKRDGRLHIGAFRVLPSNIYTRVKDIYSDSLQKPPTEKLDDYGAHKHEYYELEVFIVQSDLDIQMIQNWKKYSWFSSSDVSKTSSMLLHGALLECIAKYLKNLSINLEKLAHLSFSDASQRQKDELFALLEECKATRHDISILRNILIGNPNK